MSDDTRNVFKKNLNVLFIEKGSTQKELADYIGVHPSTINEWIKGRKVPRMDKIDKICTFFNVSREKLLGSPDTLYYDDPEVARMANELKNNPDLHILFDASKKLTKKDLEAVITIVQKMSSEE